MTDRLALIKARHAEAGGGNGDLEWLIAEVERLREELENTGSAAVHSLLDEALNSGRGVYQP